MDRPDSATLVFTDRMPLARTALESGAARETFAFAPSQASTCSVPNAINATVDVEKTDHFRPAGVQASVPRLLVVDQSGQLGGAQLALLPLLDAWRNQCEVVLFSNGPFRDRVHELGVEVTVQREQRVVAIRKGRSRLDSLFALPAMIRQIGALARRARVSDVVYLNTQKALVLGALAGKLARKPVVWHAHDIMSRGHFGALQLALVRFIVRHWVDLVIANSQASETALRSLTGLPQSTFRTLHNGICAIPFENVDDSARQDLRRSLGLPDGVFAAGLFGRLSPWKGIHVALDAMALLPSMHLVIVGAALFGEDDYEAMLKRKVSELALDARVHFIGFRDDIPALMKALDAVLHTAIEPEPFGRVVVEGMMARRPVVATAAGGVLEIIDHRKNGLLIAPNDAYALADALSSLASSPAWAQGLGETAFASAVKRFGVQDYINGVSKLLTDVFTRKCAV